MRSTKERNAGAYPACKKDMENASWGARAVSLSCSVDASYLLEAHLRESRSRERTPEREEVRKVLWRHPLLLLHKNLRVLVSKS